MQTYVTVSFPCGCSAVAHEPTEQKARQQARILARHWQARNTAVRVGVYSVGVIRTCDEHQYSDATL